jgi:hypothetical protein
VPAHAQRIDSLLAADRESTACRESKGGRVRWGARCGPGGGRAWGSGSASGVHGEGPTQGLGGQGTPHAAESKGGIRQREAHGVEMRHTEGSANRQVALRSRGARVCLSSGECGQKAQLGGSAH